MIVSINILYTAIEKHDVFSIFLKIKEMLRQYQTVTDMNWYEWQQQECRQGVVPLSVISI